MSQVWFGPRTPVQARCNRFSFACSIAQPVSMFAMPSTVLPVSLSVDGARSCGDSLSDPRVPALDLGSPTTFGRINRQATTNTPRNMEFGLRIHF